jgi:senataxin
MDSIILLPLLILTSNIGKTYYLSQVLKIPETFQSAIDYKNFFVPLLFEETRADLSSSLYGVSQAPFCEMADVEKSTQLTSPIPEARNQFIHFEHVIRLKSRHEFDEVENYIPVSGDVIAFTHIRPRSLNDLNTLKSPYRIAYVKEAKKEFFRNGDGPRTLYIRISFLTSKCMKMDVESDLQNNKELKLYAVYLMNMTTNVRIWKALKSISHMNIIKTVLGPRKLVSIIF